MSDRHPTRRRIPALFLALACALPLAPAAHAGRGDDRVDLADWHRGPVLYIARKAEIQQFKKLKNDTERALFIERFWARRDPTPGTLTNEYRQLFWERVREANDNFVDSPKDGWKTDRGKVYILYGPPTEITEDIHLQTEGLGAATGPGLIRWVYEGRPGERSDLNAVVVVPFVRDSGGEYRLSYDPKLSSVFFDPLAIREGRNADLDRLRDFLGSPTRSRLSVMLDLGRMQEVPPQAQVLLERVETVETYQTEPLDAIVTRYERDDRIDTTVAVTVDLAGTEPGTTPALVARFTPDDATRQQRLLGEDSFRVAEGADYRVAQARIELEPGLYTMTVLLADPVKLETRLHRSEVRIEPRAERMHLSDVAFTDHLDSLDYAALASYDEPFLVGAFRVVPRASDATFTAGDEVGVFYEVYGATLPLRVSYQLQGRESDGSWVDLGAPASAEQPAVGQAWALATAESWPPADYRIRIEVEDADGRRVARDVAFSLEAPASEDRDDDGDGGE